MADENDLIGALEHQILGGRHYTGEDVARLAGVPFALAEQLWVELGFPPAERTDPAFFDADVEALRSVSTLAQERGIDPQAIMGMARVLGQALSRVAAAQVNFSIDRLQLLDQPDDQAGRPPGTGDGAATLHDAVAVTMALSEQFIIYAWRRHLVAAVERTLDPREREVIGFCDLVGYTRLTSRLDETELPALIGHFQHIVTAHVSTVGGQVVKLIGDAVMFATVDAAPAVEASLGIRDELRQDESAPSVRIGLAAGPVVHLEGDVYGDTVNRASRLAELARPDSILVDDDIGAELFDGGSFDVRQLRPRRLKGIGLVRSWAVRGRRRHDDDESAA